MNPAHIEQGFKQNALLFKGQYGIPGKPPGTIPSLELDRLRRGCTAQAAILRRFQFISVLIFYILLFFQEFCCQNAVA